MGPIGEICGGCVLFENGPGGGTAGDGFTNYNVSNNLFVNSGGSLPIQVQTTTGGTVSNNTVADGFQYGIAIGYNGVTGVQSTNLNSQYNIVAGQTDNGQAYRYGAASGTSDHNVADSHGGTSGTGSLNGWTEAWQTTNWSNPTTTPMPAGYYQPVTLGSLVRVPGQHRPVGPSRIADLSVGIIPFRMIPALIAFPVARARPHQGFAGAAPGARSGDIRGPGRAQRVGRQLVRIRIGTQARRGQPGAGARL